MQQMAFAWVPIQSAHSPFGASRLCRYRSTQLVLRRFAEGDLHDHLEYASDPQVARYEYWEPYTLKRLTEEARQAQDTVPGAEARWLELAVEIKAERKVIGSVGIKVLSRQHRLGEVGWTLSRKYQGRGYATEAGSAILRFGFEELDLFWIISFCHVRNAPSYRLMERLGMRRLAHFERSKLAKGEWWDEVVYSITEPEWRLMSGAAGAGPEPPAPADTEQLPG